MQCTPAAGSATPNSRRVICTDPAEPRDKLVSTLLQRRTRRETLQRHYTTRVHVAIPPVLNSKTYLGKLEGGCDVTELPPRFT